MAQDLRLALSPALGASLGTPADPPPRSLLPLNRLPRAPRAQKQDEKGLRDSCHLPVAKKLVPGTFLEMRVGGGVGSVGLFLPRARAAYLSCSARCLSLF